MLPIHRRVYVQDCINTKRSSKINSVFLFEESPKMVLYKDAASRSDNPPSTVPYTSHPTWDTIAPSCQPVSLHLLIRIAPQDSQHISPLANPYPSESPHRLPSATAATSGTFKSTTASHESSVGRCLSQPSLLPVESL
jgi:hypothetical protein